MSLSLGKLMVRILLCDLCQRHQDTGLSAEVIQDKVQLPRRFSCVSAVGDKALWVTALPWYVADRSSVEIQETESWLVIR